MTLSVKDQVRNVVGFVDQQVSVTPALQPWHESSHGRHVNKWAFPITLYFFIYWQWASLLISALYDQVISDITFTLSQTTCHSLSPPVLYT